MIRKDEIDGFFQQHRAKLLGISAAAAAVVATIALQAICMQLPVNSRDLCLAGIPVATDAIRREITSNAGNPHCEPVSRCTSVAGPLYSLQENDGGFCDCLSK